jgi:hypothetical protein
LSLLVYTPKITTRFQYVFRQLFVRILEIPVSFTSSLDAFVAFSGAKFSYAPQPLGQEFHVYASGFLTEQGISYQELKKGEWQGLQVLFSHNNNSRIPFDIFAASFYCLSRYEEYLPHLKDEENRYPASASWLTAADSLEIPLVDAWAVAFLKELQQEFPDLSSPDRDSDGPIRPFFTITSPFKYLYKPSLTKLGQWLQSVWHLKLWDALEQCLVELRILRDPFDTYDQMIPLLSKGKVAPAFYFLFAQKPYEGIATAIYNTKLQALIKGVSDDFPVSVLFSHHAQQDTEELAFELNNVKQLIHRPILRACFHRGVGTISEGYAKLLEQEVHHDLSMGYEETIGYRASTAVPFYYYDLENEYQTPLMLHPIVATEKGLRMLGCKRAFDKLEKLLKAHPTPTAKQRVAFSNAIWQDEESNRPWRQNFLNYLEHHARP